MTFQVITDPDKLRELGEAGLLWYYWCGEGAWRPSINSPASWGEFDAKQLCAMTKRKAYAILLED